MITKPESQIHYINHHKTLTTRDNKETKRQNRSVCTF